MIPTIARTAVAVGIDGIFMEASILCSPQLRPHRALMKINQEKKGYTFNKPWPLECPILRKRSCSALLAKRPCSCLASQICSKEQQS